MAQLRVAWATPTHVSFTKLVEIHAATHPGTRLASDTAALATILAAKLDASPEP